jgi:hypothetical protein
MGSMVLGSSSSYDKPKAHNTTVKAGDVGKALENLDVHCDAMIPRKWLKPVDDNSDA